MYNIYTTFVIQVLIVWNQKTKNSKIEKENDKHWYNHASATWNYK